MIIDGVGDNKESQGMKAGSQASANKMEEDPFAEAEK